jgi:hypothetical protein
MTEFGRALKQQSGKYIDSQPLSYFIFNQLVKRIWSRVSLSFVSDAWTELSKRGKSIDFYGSEVAPKWYQMWSLSLSLDHTGFLAASPKENMELWRLEKMFNETYLFSNREMCVFSRCDRFLSASSC